MPDDSSTLPPSSPSPRDPHANAASSRDQHDSWVGQTLAGYFVMRRLGEGGMGVVYLGRHQSLDRLAAIKFLAAHMAANPTYVERFLNEAKGAAKLDHPNIVAVYDAGKVGENTYYFIMAYVEGRDLRSIQREKGVFPVLEAVGHIRQAAAGLGHAHRKGIIHRDVKPDNLMLAADGILKVGDLGLAKWTETDAGGMTQSGVVLGTPYYISPEQVRGSRNVDVRSDIYSLGATLYHMVTGKIPYEGSSPAEIMARHLKDPVPEPHEANRALDSEICAIIQRMMAKNPDDRYATMDEVEVALGEYVARKTQPSSARAVSRASRSREAAVAGESNAPVKAGLIVGLSIVFAAVILGGVAWWGLSSLRPVQEISSDGAEPPASEEKSTPSTPQPRQFDAVLAGMNGGGTRRLPQEIKDKILDPKFGAFLYSQNFSAPDMEHLPDGVECFLMGWSSGRRTSVDASGVELENLSARWQIDPDEVDESKRYLRLVLGPETVPPTVTLNARFDFKAIDPNQTCLLVLLLRSTGDPVELQVRVGSESHSLHTLQVGENWTLYVLPHVAKPGAPIVFITLGFGNMRELHIGGVWVKLDQDGSLTREIIPSAPMPAP